MSLRKLIFSGILSAGIILGSASIGYGQDVNYMVQAGDTFWKISQKYGVSLSLLMSVNNATENTILNIGDKIVIPQKTQTPQDTIYTVQAGDTFWKISQKYKVDIKSVMAYNNATEQTTLYIGQKVKIPNAGNAGASGGTSSGTSNSTPVQPPSSSTDSSKPYITYTQYTVQKGDTLWDIAIKFGIPQAELLNANNLTESSYVNIGDKLKIPVHNVPIKTTPGEKYGEYLDWWTEAQYVIPVGSVFEVVDFATGKTFKVKRTTGANHADCEALTISDTNIMKQIWGGSLSWATRPIIIKYNGRKIAASASSLPHAGNDAVSGGIYTTWRSNNYGPGYNLDWVKNNGMDGVFDIHFPNSTRHSDGKIDQSHQDNIKIAAGLK